MPAARVVTARQTPENRKHMVPLRPASSPNLYFAGDGRDIPYDLSLIVLASAMEVADAIAASATSPATPALAPASAH